MKASSSVCSFGESGYTWWRMPSLRTPLNSMIPWLAVRSASNEPWTKRPQSHETVRGQIHGMIRGAEFRVKASARCVNGSSGRKLCGVMNCCHEDTIPWSISLDYLVDLPLQIPPRSPLRSSRRGAPVGPKDLPPTVGIEPHRNVGVGPPLGVCGLLFDLCPASAASTRTSGHLRPHPYSNHLWVVFAEPGVSQYHVLVAQTGYSKLREFRGFGIGEPHLPLTNGSCFIGHTSTLYTGMGRVGSGGELVLRT